MHKKKKRKGRPFRVFKQGQAQISFNGRNVTAQGGLALVARGMDGVGLGPSLNNALIDLDTGVVHPTGKMIEQLSVLRFISGEALEDTSFLDNRAIKKLFSWETIADPTTFSRRLKRFDGNHHSALRAISSKLARRSISGGKQALIALDSTVVPVYGEQMEGAEIGYNPTKPGRPSYHPLLAVHIDSRSVVDGLLRPGNAASNTGWEEFITRVAEACGLDPEEIIFRLDKGLTSGEIMTEIEGRDSYYLAKVSMTAPLRRRIEANRRWRSIGHGAFAASFKYQARSWKKPRRLVVIERNVEPKKSDQGELFELFDRRYEIIATNLNLNSENIWRLYNKGAIVEQVIKEVKSDFGSASLRTDSFCANQALWLSGLIAYNLFNYIRRKSLPASFRTARLKRIALLFFNLGAKVVSKAGRLWIKINRDYPLRHQFYRAMDALGTG